MHSRFSFLLVLVLLTFLGGCAASGSPHAVDERGCSRFAHLFPKAAQERGIDGLTTSGFDSERYGDVLFRQLSPDFINQEPGHDIYLGENFHRTLTPQSHVFRDKDGQGFSIVHPSQKLFVRMLAVVDWNGDGVEEWLARCRVENYIGGLISDYYLLVPVPRTPQEMVHATIAASAESYGAGYRPAARLRDTSSFGRKSEEMPETKVEDYRPGQTAITAPPAAGSAEKAHVQERDL